MTDHLFLVGTCMAAGETMGAAGGPNGWPAFQLAAAGSSTSPYGEALERAGSGQWRLSEVKSGAGAPSHPAGAPAAGAEEIARFQVLARREGMDGWTMPPVAITPSGAPAGRDLLVNGIQPLGLRLLKPGDLISAGGVEWILLRRHTPDIGPAPSDVAASSCPVCGLRLDAAPVCQCPCGTWYHLENPAGDPDSESELNCFNSPSLCSVCREARSLEEAWIPSPGELHL